MAVFRDIFSKYDAGDPEKIQHKDYQDDHHDQPNQTANSASHKRTPRTR